MRELPRAGERVDRIDISRRGWITEHVMGSDGRTICGLTILNWQKAGDGFMRNAQCKRCQAIEARRGA